MGSPQDDNTKLITSGKTVLIAHQSTIPHYRVPFYQAVSRLKPPWWDFEVVFDENPSRRERLFVEPVNVSEFGFEILPTRTISFRLFGKQILFQTFVRHARQYNLVVLEDALHNLSYPLTMLWTGGETAVAYWGHGRDVSAVNAGFWKRRAESLKLQMSKKSEGYFAYTDSVRENLIRQNVKSQSIHVLNNTIDINAERRVFESLIRKRQLLREANHLEDRKVLLYVGRLTKNKRLEFLGETVRNLRRTKPEYHLLIVGGGDQSIVEALSDKLGVDGMTYCGVIVDRPQLAKWYVCADAYLFPGDIGLGVVQALCHDLTPVVVHRPTHHPEYDYLSNRNSVIGNQSATPAEYGAMIDELCANRALWNRYREQAWPSIKHLTIDAMAQRFIAGVNEILRNPRSRNRPKMPKRDK